MQHLLIFIHFIHTLASSLLATSGLNTMEAYPVHFIFIFMPGGFLSRSCGIFVVAQFWWLNDIDISQGENNMDFYLVTKPGPGVKNSQDWYPYKKILYLRIARVVRNQIWCQIWIQRVKKSPCAIFWGNWGNQWLLTAYCNFSLITCASDFE